MILAKKTLILLLLLPTFPIHAHTYQWAVIGAGPAGIISTTILLEHIKTPKDILWLDPEFGVGRLGKYYGNVPSNLKAYRYTTFLSSCALFNQLQCSSFNAIRQYDQQDEPVLQLLIDPLQEITNYLQTQVQWHRATVRALDQENGLWNINTRITDFYAHNVILATGSHPKKLNIPGPQEIPLDMAIDATKLKGLILPTDVVMVVGSAHSALLILKYLTDLPVQKIINVYTKQPTYGMYGGLEGVTARWTKEVLETNSAPNIERIPYNHATIKEIALNCTKIIYAFGFERSTLPINGSRDLCFDYKTGLIKPHLYGIGIAFPEEYLTKEGNTVNLIGVNSFMKYAKEHVPIWINGR